MPDDRTRTADACPDVVTSVSPSDPGVTASDGRAANPDSTRPSSRPHGNAPAGVVQIPGYEVRGELARGGMGRVLEAYDLAFGREVAIKVVLPGPDAVATAGRFVRESRITGRLTHPGIPPAYQLGELPDGSPFLAMKLVRGRTLAELLAERPDVGHDLPRFVAIFEQVCQAVGYAHSRGIIHRDLKPANVMVGAFGEVQVMDWGLARDTRAGETDPDGPPIRPWDAAGSTIGDDRTQAGAVMGTPAYMAPEQACGEDVDARADVFALGGLLAMILVGRAPFQSASADAALALAAAGDTAEVLAALAASVADGELVDVGRRCLAVGRNDRPDDGRAVAALASAYRQGVDERLRVAERERAAAEAKATEEANTRREAEAKLSEQRRRRRAQLAAAVAVVVLVAAAGAGAAWRVQDIADRKADALRLDGEEKERSRVELLRKQRASAEVAGLLEQAKTALEGEDIEKAEPLVHRAVTRVTDEVLAEYSGRAGEYQADSEMLRELARIDEDRWTLLGTKYYKREHLVERWAASFSKYGITVGGTARQEAATRINRSAIRSALLSGLEGWLARATRGESETILAILNAADPDPFRAEVRQAIASRDGGRVRRLAERPEWLSQPIWLVRAQAVARQLGGFDNTSLVLRLVRDRPDDFGLLMDLATGYPDQPAVENERIRWLQAAIALRPRSVSARLNLADALDDRGDYDGAVSAYTDAIKIDPNSPVAHHNFGLLIMDRDTDRAEVAFRESIRLEPTLASSHYNLGKALTRLGREEEAEASYVRCVQHDPKYAPAYVNLGELHHGQGKFRSAVRYYREAIQADPSLPAARHNLGELLRQRGELDEGIIELSKAVRLDPRLDAAHNSLGLAHRDKGDLNAAAGKFRDAININSQVAGFHYNLGNVLRDSGDLGGAASAFRAAVRLTPTYPQANCNLGLVLARSGDFVEAAWYLRRGHQLGSAQPGWRYPSAQWVEACDREIARRGLIAPPPRPVGW